MEVVAILGYIAGGLISVGIIWTKGIVPTARFVKRTHDVYERIESLPEWCATVDTSLKQLDYNGGKSLRDRVDQTHAMMVAHMGNGHDHSGV